MVIRGEVVGTRFIDAVFTGRDFVSASGGLDIPLGTIACLRWTLRGKG